METKELEVTESNKDENSGEKIYSTVIPEFEKSEFDRHFVVNIVNGIENRIEFFRFLKANPAYAVNATLLVDDTKSSLPAFILRMQSITGDLSLNTQRVRQAISDFIMARKEQLCPTSTS